MFVARLFRPAPPLITRRLHDGMPAGCPVVALGHHSKWLYFLDSQRRVRKLMLAANSRMEILALFGGRTDFIYRVDQWTRKNQRGRVVDWLPSEVRGDLIHAALSSGPFDPRMGVAVIPRQVAA